MRQKSKTLHLPEFMARAQQALDRTQRAIINSDDENPLVLVEAIARDKDLIGGAQLIADCYSSSTLPEDESRDIATHLEIGIRAGLELAEYQPVRALIHAGSLWRNKAMLSVALLAALLVIDISNNDLAVWKVLAAIALVTGIGGLLYRLGKRAGVQTSVRLLTRP